MIILAWFCLVCAAVPAILYLWNAILFREPPAISGESSRPSISVLIPARNEEAGIAACVASVLASRHVDIEVVVLDDHSTDRTADIVRTIASTDDRLRLESASSLPDGWCGKQHACYELAKLARYEVFAFLDADVRLAPDGLARMAMFLAQSRAGLVSGFPRQETGSILEKLLIPLINWLLLGFLPICSMRRRCWAAFGAGCGQWFLTYRQAYWKVGGHAAVKASRHDGVTLPRAFRRAGFMTDICDARRLATCRMYRSARDVWLGLAKNAREGLATTGQIGFWTTVLLCGQVLPLPLLGIGWALGSETWSLFGWAALASFAQRLLLAVRFDCSILGTLLHPLAILLLLGVQWDAIRRAILGRPVGWKGRERPGGLSHPRAAAPAVSQ